DWFLIDGASGATAERRAQIRREARVALLGDVINFPLPDINAVWQPKDLGDEFRKPVKSKAPALFISGTLDANTPPHRTEEVRQGFPNAAHLIIENAGHQDLLRGPGIIEAVAAFVQGKKVESKKFALPAPELIPMTAGKKNPDSCTTGCQLVADFGRRLLAETDDKLAACRTGTNSPRPENIIDHSRVIISQQEAVAEFHHVHGPPIDLPVLQKARDEILRRRSLSDARDRVAVADADEAGAVQRDEEALFQFVGGVVAEVFQPERRAVREE